MSFSTIPELLAEFKEGRPVILVDDEDRENEGDLIMPAELTTPDVIAFMAKQGSGLICLALAPDIVSRLGLTLIGRRDNAHHDTAFLMPIEAKEGVTTGISAEDRAHTIAVAVNARSTSLDLATPGHVFPLQAHPGGVKARPGHTEAAVELAKLGGYAPAGVICEIMNEDGTMARRPQLDLFAEKHKLRIGTIDALARYLTQQAA